MGQRLDIFLHAGDVMNAEEIRKALMQPISVETRLDWLETDSADQRTAILKLERAARLICKSLWALLAVNMLLALAVLT
jgi:hypothetical protein